MTYIRSVCFIAILFCCTSLLQAQKSYDFSAGLRLGWLDVGVSAKGFISESVALQGIVTTPYQWQSAEPWLSRVSVVGLGEWHVFSADLPGFGLVLGGGWFLDVPTLPASAGTNQRIFTGPTAIIGLEYTLPKTPLAFQLDGLPSYVINEGLNLDLSLCIRYTF